MCGLRINPRSELGVNMVTTRSASPSVTGSNPAATSLRSRSTQPSTSSPLTGKTSSSTKWKYDPAPVSHHYEFGGPFGALGVILAVPFFTYWLSFACTEATGCPPWPLSSFSAYHSSSLDAMKDVAWWKSLISLEASAVYCAWYAWNVLCWAVLPGKSVQGGELRNGAKVTYPMNGALYLCFSI